MLISHHQLRTVRLGVFVYWTGTDDLEAAAPVKGHGDRVRRVDIDIQHELPFHIVAPNVVALAFLMARQPRGLVLQVPRELYGGPNNGLAQSLAAGLGAGVDAGELEVQLFLQCLVFLQQRPLISLTRETCGDLRGADTIKVSQSLASMLGVSQFWVPAVSSVALGDTRCRWANTRQLQRVGGLTDATVVVDVLVAAVQDGPRGRLVVPPQRGGGQHSPVRAAHGDEGRGLGVEESALPELVAEGLLALVRRAERCSTRPTVGAVNAGLGLI